MTDEKAKATCTWKDCLEEGTESQTGQAGVEWACLCAGHAKN